jgi:hypothetical protein
LIGPLTRPKIGIGINNGEGTRVCTVFPETVTPLDSLNKNQVASWLVRTEPLRLPPGPILVKVTLSDQGKVNSVYNDALILQVREYSPYTNAPPVRPAGTIWPQIEVAKADKEGATDYGNLLTTQADVDE